MVYNPPPPPPPTNVLLYGPLHEKSLQTKFSLAEFSFDLKEKCFQRTVVFICLDYSNYYVRYGLFTNKETKRQNEPHHEKTCLFAYTKNKGADRLCRYHRADQHLCFRYMDSTIPLLPKSKDSSL